MEFHGTIVVIEIGKDKVRNNSTEFYAISSFQFRWHQWIPWNSMEFHGNLRFLISMTQEDELNCMELL